MLYLIGQEGINYQFVISINTLFFLLLIVEMLKRTYELGKVLLSLQKSFAELGKFMSALSFIIIAFFMILKIAGKYLMPRVKTYGEVFFYILNGFISKGDIT